MVRPSRQRPISCHFCRVRKLRCSRQFPCTNCTSRGVPCREPTDPPPASRPVNSRKTPTASSAAGASPASSDVLARLERLESLLAIRSKELEGVGVKLPEPSPVSTPRSQQPLPPKLEGLTADAVFLERSCLGPKLNVSKQARSSLVASVADHLISGLCAL